MTTIRDKDGLCVLRISHAKQIYSQGDPAVLVEKNHDCMECGRVHDLEKCPKCDSWITHGFGLAGGGFGPYWSCNNDACNWFRKECLPPNEE